MNGNAIHTKLEKISAVFQHFKDLGSTQDDQKIILDSLEHTHPEFRSVAYEAVAMALALKDLRKGFSFELWNSFMQGPGINYHSQVHVGLGWAIAQESKPYDQMSSVEYFMRPRVLDGCGYYDAVFRSRQTIKNKKLPEALRNENIAYYDQGIGRSLWFLSNGNSLKTNEFIRSFDVSRHADLWRGAGHSATFIGGCDEQMLDELFLMSAEHRQQLAIGAAMAARGRVKAGIVTTDIELACQIWWHLSAEEVSLMTDKVMPPATSENCYNQWLLEIENEFCTTHVIRK